MIRDVRRKLPFDSASVDYIYTSHLIEHLTVKEAERMVSECYRVLRPGGTIRVVCPDLELMANTYLREREAFDDDDSDHYPADRFLEVANIYKAQGETGIAFRLAKFARHKWLYDKQTLGELLRRSGFTDVTNMAYKEGTVPDLEQLDNRPDHSLHMEAKKPYV
jgi:predicted SAM-dependent methyltransferase